jgi:hypothetical protein
MRDSLGYIMAEMRPHLTAFRLADTGPTARWLVNRCVFLLNPCNFW